MVVAKKRKPKTKTTRADFELFKRECERWIRYFGLNDWYIEYEHTPGKDGARAWFNTEVLDGITKIELTKDWGSDIVTIEAIKKSAFHEICELLLARFYANAITRYTIQNDINESRHAIIRILENTLYRDVKPR